MNPYANSSAVGFSFSVKSGNKINTSLRNIKTELKNEGFTVTKDGGDLTNWVKQGVFLLNTALTVSEGNSGSHLEMWKKFTNSAIKFITKKQNLAILLFGNKAKEFKECISQFSNTSYN